MTAVRDTAGRDYRGRWYVCEGCGREVVTSARTGRLPRRCDDCLPPKARSYRERARNSRARADALVAELARVEGRLAAAERALRVERSGPRALPVRELDAPVFDEVETRARVLGPPGVEACKRGLVRLRHARGATETAERADDLAAALTLWARLLRTSHLQEPGSPRRKRAA